MMIINSNHDIVVIVKATHDNDNGNGSDNDNDTHMIFALRIFIWITAITDINDDNHNNNNRSTSSNDDVSTREGEAVRPCNFHRNLYFPESPLKASMSKINLHIIRKQFCITVVPLGNDVYI